MNELISVIVPAYNVAPYLPNCLDSLLAQTYSNMEIIVIDDGSTDNTAEIIDQYASKDQRIRVIHQNNEGLVKVRDKGISVSKGEFVGFVDGDDEIEPDMYERLLNNALLYKTDISQCGILTIFYDGREVPLHGTGVTKVFSQEEGLRELLDGTYMEPSLCNKLYKSDILKNSCLDETIINNEDLLRNFVLFSRAESSVFEDFCGYHYKIRKISMSNSPHRIDVANHIIAARKQILNRAPKEVYKQALNSYLIAVINAYDYLIKNKSAEAAKYKDLYKDDLRALRPDLKILSGKQQVRIYMILYFPHLYSVIIQIHKFRRDKKIEKEVKLKEKGNLYEKV